MAARIFDAFIIHAEEDIRVVQRFVRRLKASRNWYGGSLLSVRWDKASMPAGSVALKRAICDCMIRCRHAIVLCSPKARHSGWVDWELRLWRLLQLRQQRRAQRALPGAADSAAPPSRDNPLRVVLALTDGTIQWDDATQAFDANASTALPPRLATGYFPAQPIHANLGGARDTTYEYEVSRVAGALLGREPTAEQSMRRRWVARRLVGVAIAVGLLALWVRTDRQASRTHAMASKLLRHAEQSLQQDPRIALRLAFEAAQLEQSEDAFTMLDRVLWHLAGLPVLTGHARPVTSLAFSPTEPLLLSTSVDGTARLWRYEDHPSGGDAFAVLRGGGGPVVAGGFDRSGRMVWTLDDREASIWSVDEVRLLRCFPRPTNLRAPAPRIDDAEHFSMRAADGMHRNIWSTTTGDLVDVVDETDPLAALVAPADRPTTRRIVRPDGRQAIGITDTATAWVWNLERPGVPVDVITPDQPIRDAVYSADSRFLVLLAGAPSGEHLRIPFALRVLRADSREPHLSVRIQGLGVFAAACDHRSEWVATPMDDSGQIVLWPLDPMSHLTPPPPLEPWERTAYGLDDDAPEGMVSAAAGRRSSPRAKAPDPGAAVVPDEAPVDPVGARVFNRLRQSLSPRAISVGVELTNHGITAEFGEETLELAAPAVTHDNAYVDTLNDQAEVQLRADLERDPRNGALRVQLGLLLAMEHKTQEAWLQVTEAERLLREEAWSADRNLRYARTLALLGRDAEAASLLERSSRAFPDHWPTRMRLASDEQDRIDALSSAGQFQEADEATRKLLDGLEDVRLAYHPSDPAVFDEALSLRTDLLFSRMLLGFKLSQPLPPSSFAEWLRVAAAGRRLGPLASDPLDECLLQGGTILVGAVFSARVELLDRLFGLEGRLPPHPALDLGLRNLVERVTGPIPDEHWPAAAVRDIGDYLASLDVLMDQASSCVQGALTDRAEVIELWRRFHSAATDRQRSSVRGMAATELLALLGSDEAAAAAAAVRGGIDAALEGPDASSADIAGLGLLCWARGDRDAALACVEHLVLRSPELGRLRALAPAVVRSLMRPDVAGSVAATMKDESAHTTLVLATRSLEAGQFELAATQFALATHQDPQSALAWSGHGIALLREDKDHEVAERSFLRASRLEKLDHKPACGLAMLSARRGDWAAARRWSMQAALLAPELPGVHLAEAEISFAALEASASAGVVPRRQDCMQALYASLRGMELTLGDAGIMAADDTGDVLRRHLELTEQLLGRMSTPGPDFECSRIRRRLAFVRLRAAGIVQDSGLAGRWTTCAAECRTLLAGPLGSDAELRGMLHALVRSAAGPEQGGAVRDLAQALADRTGDWTDAALATELAADVRIDDHTSSALRDLVERLRQRVASGLPPPPMGAPFVRRRLSEQVAAGNRDGALAAARLLAELDPVDPWPVSIMVHLLLDSGDVTAASAALSAFEARVWHVPFEIRVDRLAVDAAGGDVDRCSEDLKAALRILPRPTMAQVLELPHRDGSGVRQLGSCMLALDRGRGPASRASAMAAAAQASFTLWATGRGDARAPGQGVAEDGVGPAFFALAIAAASTDRPDAGIEEWLRLASDAGMLQAMMELAGRLASRDEDAAIRYVGRAAVGGLADAQYQWAVLIGRGRAHPELGEPARLDAVVDWLERAGDGGSEEAMQQLVRLFGDGPMRIRDAARARRWRSKLEERRK